MKPEIYKALAELSRGFDAALESLKVLEQEGVLSADYVQQKREVIEEIRTKMKRGILLTD